MIKVHPDYVEVFGRNSLGILEILGAAFNMPQDRQQELRRLYANSHTDIHTCVGGEPV